MIAACSGCCAGWECQWLPGWVRAGHWLCCSITGVGAGGPGRLTWGPGPWAGEGSPREWAGMVRVGGALMALKKGAQGCPVHVNNYD